MKNTLWLLLTATLLLSCTDSQKLKYLPGCKSNISLLIETREGGPEKAREEFETFLASQFETAFAEAERKLALPVPAGEAAYQLTYQNDLVVVLSFSTREKCECVKLLDNLVLILQERQLAMEQEAISNAYQPELERIERELESLKIQIRKREEELLAMRKGKSWEPYSLEEKWETPVLDSLTNEYGRLMERNIELTIELAGVIPRRYFVILGKAVQLR